MKKRRTAHATRTDLKKPEREQNKTELPEPLAAMVEPKRTFRIPWLELAGPVITACSIILGVWQFNREKSEEGKLEFRRNVWTRQIEAYGRLGEAVGAILNTGDTLNLHIRPSEAPIFDSIASRFRSLQLGTLPLFQDSIVRRSIIEFGWTLRDYRSGDKPYGDLWQAGTVLMETCKLSSDNSWKNISDE